MSLMHYVVASVFLIICFLVGVKSMQWHARRMAVIHWMLIDHCEEWSPETRKFFLGQYRTVRRRFFASIIVIGVTFIASLVLSHFGAKP